MSPSASKIEKNIIFVYLPIDLNKVKILYVDIELLNKNFKVVLFNKNHKRLLHSLLVHSSETNLYFISEKIMTFNLQIFPLPICLFTHYVIIINDLFTGCNAAVYLVSYYLLKQFFLFLITFYCSTNTTNSF